MSSAVERGVLRGRPFGGVMTLVSKRLHNFTKIVCATDRYVIVIVGNSLIINVYFPCVGTADRCSLGAAIYPSHSVLIGGDFNTDLDKASPVTQMLCSFLSEVNLTRCDRLFHGPYLSTYHNESLNHESNIDFFAVSNPEAVLLFSVLDLA